jgi:signal transduction histidine kinase
MMVVMIDRLRDLAQRARQGVARAGGSARARILGSYVVLLLFATVVSVIAIRELLLARVDDRVEATLVQETDEFRRLVGGSDPRTGEPFGTDLRAIFDVYRSRNVPAEGEQILTFLGNDRYQTISTRGTDYLLHSDPGLAERWGALTEPESGEVETLAGPARYAALPVELDGKIRGRFVVANLVEGEREEVEESIQVVGGVAIGVLVLGTVLGFIAAGRVLAPLERLTETARQIGESDLTRRIPVRGSDEIAEQARTFNAMLDRLESAFESQRSLIRDVSHELRTPITIVRGNLEVLDEDDDPAERRETLELVTDELDRITRLVDDLLVLARSERPDFLELETVDLSAFSSELLAKAASLGERDWRLESRGSGLIVADRQRLTQAMLNLAENAVHQTEEGDPLVLGTSRAGREVRLWVRDWGPGVEPSDQRRIFERFARSRDDSSHDGTGLGLAIVEAIAEAHGGKVMLDSRPGGGARFTIVFPMDPEMREAM